MNPYEPDKPKIYMADHYLTRKIDIVIRLIQMLFKKDVPI
jgi:hypothetical protein